jgi:beta-phosphoglucomutase
MLKAIIFDFNGIILDDEPLHCRAAVEMAAGLGIRVTREEYYANYLPFDDVACLEAICNAHGVTLTAARKAEALRAKASRYRDLLRQGHPFFPGVAAFVQRAAARYPLALASGARRDEIESTLGPLGLLDRFLVILGAEDFRSGKPSPASYLQALEELNAALGQSPAILPRECLVIEDSVGGVRGVRAAGMACLAVAGTYPREKLAEANAVVDSLADLPIDLLDSYVEAQP